MPNDRANCALVQKARMEALLRRNTRRLVLHGRLWGRYAAIASPTSAGREGRFVDRLSLGRSPLRRPSQYRQSRERPLRLHATPVVRAGARSRNRDDPWRCVDRYWPAVDGSDPPQSRAGSRTSTNSPRWARPRPNHA
jgi:hypothetical protein